ncbi:hypothetical protein LR48_Vigan03g016800 [Vigna angularis]|uniref:Protein PLANT CADMIUM RESISTANCE 3 n=1 Tax=Phaseolus angularis TaxID=3914 RepID=A0A0L9U282_PHAAN|nr:Protein PLANT CADMIUM RESISTANCE 3 [Vigna angularis]KOM36787.1 hypothetical protein LR48_Vigan03g016800 [Vigna angularis]
MSGSWSTGLCDCFSDCDSCCLTYCCPCVSFGRVAEILDKGEISCCLHGSLFYLLAGFTVVGGCIYACLYREKLREMYGIEGDNCTDCLVSSFCLHLSLCQNYRELKKPVDLTSLLVGKGMWKCIHVALLQHRECKVA